MVLQDAMGGLEAQERVVHRHGEVTGGVVLFQFRVEIGGQDLVELGIQNRNGTSLCAQEFFLQRDGVLQLSELLQDLDGFCDRAPVVDQVHEFLLNSGEAEELIRFLKEGQPQA